MSIQQVILQEAIGMWPVILGWAICAFGICVITVKAIRGFSLRKLSFLLKDESGVAYSINYLLTLPLYVLFIALFIELSFIMTCKMGTIYAAFAGARAGIVWDSENSESEVDQRVQFTAARAFVPFANGLTQIRRNQPSPASDAEVKKYVETYSSYNKAVANDKVYKNYVAAKYRHAMREVKTEVERNPGSSGDAWDEDFKVTVRYSYSFGTLGIGRAIGTKTSSGFYVYPITTSVTLKTELPRNDETSLGIEFATLN